MTSANTMTVTHTDRELTMSRVFDAPREAVFKAFTKPEYLSQWWGPKGWTLPVCKIDFRPGGTWLYCMRGPGGEEAWGKAIYSEIVEPERIVYTDTFCDAEGNPTPGAPEMHITVTFIEQGAATKLVSTTKFASEADLNTVLEMGVVQGFTETWDRLEALVTKS